MGPGFVHPGNAYTGPSSVTSVALQWGPGLYTREIRPPRRFLVGYRASMGPGFVHPGNFGSSSQPGFSCCFNGARVCTPGKCFLMGGQASARPASMGPGFVHPGNWIVELDTMGPDGLQWGPGLYTREIGAGSPGCGPISPLQWGPGLYTREIRHPAGEACGALASMGPGFVHPGNPGRPILVLTGRMLQWGPGLYTREIGTGLPRRGRGSSLQWGPGLYTREIAGLRRQLGYALPGAIASAGG